MRIEQVREAAIKELAAEKEAKDAHGMPVRFFVTDATVADCALAEKLIDKFPAEYLLADRAYDTNAIVEHALTCKLGVLCFR